MITRELVRSVISGIIYKDGWEFSVYDGGLNTMDLFIMFDAPDSDSRYAGNYSSAPLKWPSTLYVLELASIADEADLRGHIMAAIGCAEMHEAQEFLSFGGQAKLKPFHPHTPGAHSWRAWVESHPISWAASIAAEVANRSPFDPYYAF